LYCAFCAALLELRQRKQAGQLMIESELVAETCETVCSDRDAAVNIEWNASETDEARDTG